ncbi:MAG: hypothetical protein CVU88_01620 [Firmicutes bacterium HGW-Firmicutes-13]|nr:MAG: hypothetical protein CVU88_01620 [Firmicutes bacterium HGW-Firmicutes-13]
MQTIDVNTTQRTQFIDLTYQVERLVKEEGIEDGVCCLYVPHTTAGLTINENADPAVVQDIINTLNNLIPFEGNYRHMEGNSAAHIKASMMGSSINILVRGGKLILGTWQGAYFCEFDGPRSRKVFAKFIK